MNHFHRLALTALVLGACAPKGEAASEESARDSTSALDSTIAASVMSSPSAVLIDSASRAKALTKAGTISEKQSGIVGRDSAFGPTFIVDSTGKMVPIPKKKP